MTLKQFFQLAGGILAGFLFYSSPLLPIIKWPFAILSTILGVTLAFLPLEERPLERWIFAFFRAIYSPTMFVWTKSPVLPKFFQDEVAGTAPIPEKAEPQAPGGPLQKLEAAEKGFLATLTGLFSGAGAQTAVQGQPQPTIGVGTTLPEITAATQPTAQTALPPKEINVPQTPMIKIANPEAPHLVIEERTPQAVTQTSISTHQVAPLIAGNEMVSTKQALFSVDAAPPNPPTAPNVVVGQVVDADRKIVEGAIMEIRDSAGRPIRAIRSNKLGHFVTVTQLESGKHEIITEKDGFEFTPVSFEAVGQLIPPILVQGRKVQVQETTPVQGLPVQPAQI